MDELEELLEEFIDRNWLNEDEIENVEAAESLLNDIFCGVVSLGNEDIEFYIKFYS